MKLILKWLNILDVSIGKAIRLSVQQVHTGKQRILSAAKDFTSSDKFMYGKKELDLQDDTTVA